ncbi:MAG TPA: ABC transporter ATP-binding protein [Bacteroidales bacterium]|nr:MAG: hypothetical protein A2W98_13230 [Bacteroidetes bacterium GWF2_33_38]OFY73537.1 MAG: hypothetical protein A2265_00605 [Bacteroidetes bacterium RIFOXYA12_FULL_33_9]OFY89221.1 MAG: hypothetical protein A2236_09990 [Bacteroidetes bacterium RIFOXYA2_FULL_33_7]HBF89128.1 ABC transporter ATP-binding protein [Bacteroidales bacterium]
MNEIVLNIQELRKSYGKITALDSLSLTINKGSVYGILGPNGSGKTTTLSILMEIIKQDSGQFQWFNEENIEKAKHKIGALIESPGFYPYLSVEKNLKVVTAIKNIPESDISRVLNIVNLEKRRKSRYDTLSYGMKQRLSLASILLGDPDVLVLDEPTNGLDPEGIAEIRNIILQEAKKNKTIILASHILDEVEKVCSHVAVLKSGKLIANGKVRDLLTKDDLIVVSTDRLSEFYEFIAREGVCKTINKKDYEIELRLNENFSTMNLNELALKNGYIFSKLEVKKQSLESQFLELVK